MIWTLFVLDCDATFSLEAEDESGVRPEVYLVPEERIVEVQGCAFNAGRRFGDDYELDPDCIGDYFETFMEELNIPFQYVGNINLTFGERQVDYLADYIPREIV